MNTRLSVFLTFMAVLFVAATPAQARNAELLLSPTRVVLEGGKRYVTVIVRNNGDGVGRYKIDLVDTIMHENGGISMREDGSKDEFSAIDLLSISPRSMTLKPDESQNVRILVKMKDDLPDGEYRSHLRVKMTENDLDLATGKPAAQEGASVVLKPLMTTVIPVIIRKGKTDFKVSIDDAKLVMGGGEGKEIPEVKTVFGFSGNRSVIGDIKVTQVLPDGKDTELAFFRGIAIYRGVARREQAVALKIPEGVDLRKGELRINFLSQEKEGSQVLAEKIITP